MGDGGRTTWGGAAISIDASKPISSGVCRRDLAPVATMRVEFSSGMRTSEGERRPYVTHLSLSSVKSGAGVVLGRPNFSGLWYRV